MHRAFILPAKDLVEADASRREHLLDASPLRMATDLLTYTKARQEMEFFRERVWWVSLPERGFRRRLELTAYIALAEPS